MMHVPASDDFLDNNVRNVVTTSLEPLSDIEYMTVGVYLSIVGMSACMGRLKQGGIFFLRIRFFFGGSGEGRGHEITSR